MKYIFLTISMWLCVFFASSQDKDQKLIIITTDGFRWQELFMGMDEKIAENKAFNQNDSADLFKRYHDDTEEGRRKKLLPFIWGTIAVEGQIYGNRKYSNKVNNANPFWFSYPGYSEILTGNVDTLINSNEYKHNPHSSLLEFYHKLPTFKGRVVECLDVFTHYQAFHYLTTKKPKVLYISYGETDEFAHHGDYKFYLDAAHQFDKWIGEIWSWVQLDPDYKNKTTLLITTDHGRGDIKKEEWTSHGTEIQDASEIWFGVIGPKVKALGEMKSNQQVYQEQLAQTAASLTGHTFSCEHRVAPAITTVKK